MGENADTSVRRIVGLAVMIAASAWMAFSVFLSIGMSIAWIEETGLTEELQPWVAAALAVGAAFAGIGYIAFVLGRKLRGAP